MEFHRDGLVDDLARVQCRRCWAQGATIEFAGIDTPHFAKVVCRTCYNFVEWLSWPEKPKTDRKKSRKKLRDLDQRCELCLRHQEDLPSPGKLEVHHVLEKSADDGSDEANNLRIYCTSCHSLVSWVRTYFGHYHPDR